MYVFCVFVISSVWPEMGFRLQDNVRIVCLGRIWGVCVLCICNFYCFKESVFGDGRIVPGLKEDDCFSVCCRPSPETQ